MNMNKVTLLGYKDHGKSTLIGNLLIITGSISEQRIEEARAMSRKLGRQFEPGFILDSFEEEREGGLTIDTTRAQILYKGHAFEFIDVPGHEELIKNMISGASNADLAILVVSAKGDEGIKDQTLRHLFLAKMLGIRRIIVAVNKMDKVAYKKESFEAFSNRICKFLLAIGFDRGSMFFVPISAYKSDNLSSISKRMPWYKGKSLLDLMASVAKVGRGSTNPNLRMSVQGTLPDGMLIGRVLCGELKEGQKVLVMPQKSSYKVSKIFVRGGAAKAARQGQNVAVELDNKLGFNPRGAVICSAHNPIMPQSRLSAVIFAVQKPENDTTLNFNGIPFACRIRTNKVIDTTTGKRTAGTLRPLGAAEVTIELKDGIIAEPFFELPELGRFVLYNKNEFAGIGIIT
jgi:small GTP-binding protein